MFAKVKDTDVIISKDCDLKKPLFVIPLTTAEGIVVNNAVVVINSDVNVAVTL